MQGPRRGAWARDSRCRASGGVGVPDSRINVLKATTPSSPCRKMPKLCMSAPLSQRPAPDATVEGGPPGSPRLAFPAGPCMTELAEKRGAPRSAQPRRLQGPCRRAPSPEPGVRARSRYLRPAADSAPRVTRRLRLQRLIGPARRGGGPLPLQLYPRGAGLRPGRRGGVVNPNHRYYRPGVLGEQTSELSAGPRILSSRSVGQGLGQSVTKFVFPPR